MLGGWSKRGLDIVVATGALVALWPLFLLVMASVRLSDSGPIFYAQERIGFNGRRFRCLKFRTMVTDADRRLDVYLRSNPDAAQEWRDTQKLRDDPRVTAIGRLLRVSSMDELPQIWNVLRGDMSVVGPRPIVTAEISRYGTHFATYTSTRPGITGLWQVMGRSDCTYDQRVRYDVSYVENWSLTSDLAIILRTAYTVLRRRGSY
jgi:exopolysaccharide production protein ExoY